MSMVRRLGPLILAALAAARRSTGHGPTVSDSAEMAAALARREDELRASEERLRLAIEATGLGTWDVDLRAGTRRWSAEFRAILGLPPDAEPDPGRFASLIHPDDSDWVNARYRKAYQPPGGGYEAEFRIRRAGDGAERWVLTTGQVFVGPNGAPTRGVGTLMDVTGRRRVEEALRAGEERSRLMLDNLSEAVAAIFPDLSLPVRNRAWLRFHGFARFDELPGLRFEDLAPLFELYDAAGRRLPAEDYPLARAMRGESFEGLELHLKRTGTDWERWASYNGTSVLGPDGRVRVAMISIRDVTERVVAEGQQQLLLAELSHRVKNTLATVQVIAARSLDGGRSLAEGREALTRRLRALAQTHDLLTVSRWQGAELAAVLAAELKPYGERALVDVPALKLSPKAAQLVALVLHELATNAAKHGALSVPGGWLEVRGGLEPASGPATLRLAWREHDGPEVTVPGHRGFGRTLIEHGVRHELGGTVRLDFEPAGLVCELVVPAAAVRAGR